MPSASTHYAEALRLGGFPGGQRALGETFSALAAHHEAANTRPGGAAAAAAVSRAAACLREYLVKSGAELLSYSTILLHYTTILYYYTILLYYTTGCTGSGRSAALEGWKQLATPARAPQQPPQ